MCESYHLRCQCGQKTAELFFGRMLLNRSSVLRLYCPDCSGELAPDPVGRVMDNGWALELNMDVIGTHAASLGVSGDDLTADWIFDNGFVTWVGVTPDDAEHRNREREKIQELAKTDLKAYMAAMREWGIGREKRFEAEGWRKAQPPGGASRPVAL